MLLNEKCANINGLAFNTYVIDKIVNENIEKFKDDTLKFLVQIYEFFRNFQKVEMEAKFARLRLQVPTIGPRPHLTIHVIYWLCVFHWTLCVIEVHC